MKILYVILSILGPSGGARIICEHLNRLHDRGHEASIVALDGSESCAWFPDIRFDILRLHSFESAARQSDIVVATEANTMQPVMNVETNAPKFLFVQMRESLFFLQSNPGWAGMVEETYRKARGILKPIAISQWLKDFLEDEYGYEEIPIVPNGVNTDMFYPDPAIPKKEDLKCVLIEGHHSSEAKDSRMMAYTAAQKYRVERGPIELWGFSQIPCYGDFDRYWQWPNQDLIRQIYSSSDLLLKASRYEGRSCVDPESMACGTAICRAITPGHGDDDLIDGYNCLKVPYGNFGRFYQNFIKLLSEDDLRRQLAANALKYIKERLQWDPSIDLLEKIFQEAI